MDRRGLLFATISHGKGKLSGTHGSMLTYNDAEFNADNNHATTYYLPVHISHSGEVRNTTT
jgi:hypothetical protein